MAPFCFLRKCGSSAKGLIGRQRSVVESRKTGVNIISHMRGLPLSGEVAPTEMVTYDA